jgi:branched-subunit amino acid transport protein AzlD
MARFLIRKVVLLFLCFSVFVLSILAGTVLSAWLIRVPEL